MSIKIKNYTTEVTALRSIDLIEKLLVSFGSTNIMKEYDGFGKCISISFIVEVEKMKLPFRLPANADKVAAWLKKQQPNASEKIRLERAERIAWKQQYEMLHLQLGQIEINQLEKLEVFFPYLYDVSKQESYYQKLKASGFKQLSY